MSSTAKKHRSESPNRVTFSIITCSSSKYKAKIKGKKVDDPSGDLIEKILKNNGHVVHNRSLISDDKIGIRNSIKDALSDENIDSIITTGGTGISPSDITIESVRIFLSKDIPGFGELFRKISYEMIGSAAMITRAIAGIAKEKPIFCLPGSSNAVEIAMVNLIIPEIGHIVKHAKEI
ncbi:MAG: MogA/MoaB family molybdenum cofactor biosynthesis protein [Candidatus Bathyarchaeota archaeon]|nr:MogA/MoaB family molybdenum cofactor biosynthesis protein [Candidatus Bathyarchaeota archaeon]